MLGLKAFGELPFTTLRAGDIGATGIVTLRFASRKYVTAANDSVLPNKNFDARAARQPLLFERALTGSGPTAYGGVAASTGTIELDNGDGALDAILGTYAFDGRRVRVKVGRRGDAYSAFQTIFTGTAIGLEYDESAITIRVRSNLHKLTLPVQSDTYGGTGGTDGGADLEDKPKPLGYGALLNVTPTIVDGTSKVYQINDGSISGVSAVYERGAVLTITTDYTLDLTNGRFTLVASPAGLVTADATGDTSSGSYVSTVGAIAKRILLDRVGYAGSDLDLGAFDLQAAEQTATVGIYVPSEAVSGAAVMDTLLRPHGMFLADDRIGRVTIGRFRVASGIPTLTLDQRHIVSIARESPAMEPPASELKVAYQRNWSVQTQDVASSVTLTRKQFLAAADRLVSATDSTTANEHQLSQKPDPIQSLFSLESAAQTEADRIIDIHGVDRAVYVIRTPVGLWRTRINQPVRLTFPRWNLRNGVTGYVVSVIEDAARNEQEIKVFV